MKTVILTLFLAACAALAAAALTVGIGLFDVSARVGHIPGVNWALHTTYENSVALRAPGEKKVPKLTDDMAEIGARHFDEICSTCHSTPGVVRSATIRAMVPPPPPIGEAVKHWSPGELYWLVKNGVKMTGMPAWPAHDRTDDAWFVVAFLEKVKHGMTPEEYRKLVDMPEGATDFCAKCHGLDGKGRDNDRMPRLDILQQPYIAASLKAFRDGDRQSGIMYQAASQLTDEEIEELSKEYGKVEPPASLVTPPADEGPEIELGRKIALGDSGIPGLPACAACHGPWPEERAPLLPNLIGQREAYIYEQLQLWKKGIRGGTEKQNLMHQAVRDFDDLQMHAAAAFYAAGAPGAPAGQQAGVSAGQQAGVSAGQQAGVSAGQQAGAPEGEQSVAPRKGDSGTSQEQPSGVSEPAPGSASQPAAGTGG